MIISLAFYFSVLIFWGVPILFGASFWEVALVWGVITAGVCWMDYS